MAIFIEVRTQAEVEAIGTDAGTLAGDYKQMNNIVCDPGRDFVQIAGAFSGTYDGQGHTIDGMTLVGVDNCAMFEDSTASATIYDLGLTNVNINCSGNEGASIASDYRGKIDRCFTTGSVDTGGAGSAGGGFIAILYATAVINDSYTRVNIEGGFGMSGFARQVAALDSVNRCYASGIVTAAISGAGFSSASAAGRSVDCFFDSDVSTKPDSYVPGKTTTLMQTQSTFEDEGWDFDTIWYMGDSGYPELQVFRRNILAFGDKVTTNNPNGFGVIGDYQTPNDNPTNAGIIPFSAIDETTIVEDNFNTIVVGGVPLSVSLCYTTELYSVINQPINYYRVLDVIIASNVENEIDNDNLRSNKIGINNTFVSSSDGVRYLNCLEFEDMGVPTKSYVFYGVTMATGLYNELLVNNTYYTIDDIELNKNGEVDIIQIAWENNLVSVGRIGNNYYLIITT